MSDTPSAESAQEQNHRFDVVAARIVSKSIAWDAFTADTTGPPSDLAVRATAELHETVQEYMRMLAEWDASDAGDLSPDLPGAPR